MAHLLRPLLIELRGLHKQTSPVLKHLSDWSQVFSRPVYLGTVTSNRNYQARSELEKQRRKPLDGIKGVRQYATEAKPGDLVYKGRIGNMFKVLKVFSLTTSSVGLAVQPYLLLTYSNMPLTAALPMFGAINMFVFMNPILIHYVAKKYVSELYYNPQSGVFTAVLLTFFARKMNFTFKADDVKVPDVPGPFSMLTAKGKPLFVHEADFNDFQVYKHLMGFDKPLNILYNEEKEKEDQL